MMNKFHKHTCSLMLFDLSGFTQLIYQASRSEGLMGQVISSVQQVFDVAGSTAASSGEVKILITTGDGFIATASDPQTALDYAHEVAEHFSKSLRTMVESLPFRHRIDLRVALHHGVLYEAPLGDSHGGYPLFIGDDLNLLARVVNSQTARCHTFALTRPFLELLLAEQVLDDPDEVIQDRNQYPEQIDVFRLPG